MTSTLETGDSLSRAAASRARPILRAVPRRDHGDATITLDGEIDLSSAEQIRAAVTECLSTPAPESLLIDMSAVTFCDCAGIETLEWALGRARVGRMRFSLNGVDRRLRRVFALAQADGLLDACHRVN